MASKDKPSASPQTVELSSLPTDSLVAVKKQLDEDIEHLSVSFTKLRQAQNKFRECINNIKTGVNALLDGKTILVPLTTSLYVPGKLADTENVLVDVGTGYYVKKKTADAIKFYEGKVNSLTENLDELQKVLGPKTQNVRMVEEVIRQKMLQAQQEQQQ